MVEKIARGGKKREDEVKRKRRWDAASIVRRGKKRSASSYSKTGKKKEMSSSSSLVYLSFRRREVLIRRSRYISHLPDKKNGAYRLLLTRIPRSENLACLGKGMHFSVFYCSCHDTDISTYTFGGTGWRKREIRT